MGRTLSTSPRKMGAENFYEQRRSCQSKTFLLMNDSRTTSCGLTFYCGSRPSWWPRPEDGGGKAWRRILQEMDRFGLPAGLSTRAKDTPPRESARRNREPLFSCQCLPNGPMPTAAHGLGSFSNTAVVLASWASGLRHRPRGGIEGDLLLQ